MQLDFSRDGLMRFYAYLAAKGLMNHHTISARKAAANKMLSILDEAEASDLRKVDIDNLADRFFNLHKNDFTPESLTTYKSRLKSGVEDFVAYTTNPAGFKPQASRPRVSQSRVESRPKPTARDPDGPLAAIDDLVPNSTQNVSFPIPIREDAIVRICGLPANLTKKEAQRISNVVMALAMPTDD